MNMKGKALALLLGIAVGLPLYTLAEDWYVASGKPAARSALSSADMRAEFAAIESDIADKLPALTGNGGKLIRVNSGGTALEATSDGIEIASGGTGATTAADARENLGLEIGVDVQAYDADLTALGGLAKTDSNFVVGNGTTWVAESGSTARTSLGLGSLATLSSINNGNWSGTDLAIANGGTGASDAATARSNLGANSATNLTTGTLADARLSSNVPLINAANQFSNIQTIVTASPRLILRESDQAADNKDWYLWANSKSAGLYSFSDDAGTVSTLIEGTRDDVKLTSIAIGSSTDAPTVTINGVSAADYARLSLGNEFKTTGGNNFKITGTGWAEIFLTDLAATEGAQEVGIYSDNAHFVVSSESNTEKLIDAVQNASSQWTSLALTADSITANGHEIATVDDIGTIADHDLTIQSGGSASGGSDGDIVLIY